MRLAANEKGSARNGWASGCSHLVDLVLVLGISTLLRHDVLNGVLGADVLGDGLGGTGAAERVAVDLQN